MNDRLMASVINESRDDIDGMKFLPMTKIQTSNPYIETVLTIQWPNRVRK